MEYLPRVNGQPAAAAGWAQLNSCSDRLKATVYRTSKISVGPSGAHCIDLVS